ncbi:hypothetical protein TURU_047247 [Turdus rufiventris]|nr:hypothetical protein TURU_047247 [Turdus rufiventris]
MTRLWAVVERLSYLKLGKNINDGKCEEIKSAAGNNGHDCRNVRRKVKLRAQWEEIEEIRLLIVFQSDIVMRATEELEQDKKNFLHLFKVKECLTPLVWMDSSISELYHKDQVSPDVAEQRLQILSALRQAHREVAS